MTDAAKNNENEAIAETTVDWKLVIDLVDDHWRNLLTSPPSADLKEVGMRFDERLERIAALMPSAEQQRLFNLAVRAARDKIIEEAEADPQGLRERLGLPNIPASVGEVSERAPGPESPPHVDVNRAKDLVEDHWRDMLNQRNLTALKLVSSRFEQRLANIINDLPAAERAGFAAAVEANRDALSQAHELDPVSVRQRLGVPLLPHHKKALAAHQKSGVGAMIAEDVGRTAVRFAVWEILLRLFRR
ncbi:hypothetical protein QF000_006660 [Paraburkholderia atlantica]|uniref:hypothetical protein n=1 Tax=Paraburkholderia atlantica TaxID=2654982 RepID=UPI003D1D9E95